MTTLQERIPETQNECWGFWGTMGQQAPAAWPLAATTIASATGKCLPAVRAFLDSRYGREFADDVRDGQRAGHGLQEAIASTARNWMAANLGKQTSRRYGIPAGMPSLKGLVVVAERHAED